MTASESEYNDLNKPDEVPVYIYVTPPTVISHLKSLLKFAIAVGLLIGLIIIFTDYTCDCKQLKTTQILPIKKLDVEKNKIIRIGSS